MIAAIPNYKPKDPPIHLYNCTATLVPIQVFAEFSSFSLENVLTDGKFNSWIQLFEI